MHLRSALAAAALAAGLAMANPARAVVLADLGTEPFVTDVPFANSFTGTTVPFSDTILFELTRPLSRVEIDILVSFDVSTFLRPVVDEYPLVTATNGFEVLGRAFVPLVVGSEIQWPFTFEARRLLPGSYTIEIRGQILGAGDYRGAVTKAAVAPVPAGFGLLAISFATLVFTAVRSRRSVRSVASIRRCAAPTEDSDY
jgi:hypothetical protein